MKFLQIDSNTTLQNLISLVGNKNLPSLLQLNSLTRRSDIGQAYTELAQTVYESAAEVKRVAKVNLLNTLTADSDVFETAALMGDNGWKLLQKIGTLPGYVKVPDTANVPDSAYTIGNGTQVPQNIYSKAIDMMRIEGMVDPVIFNQYNTHSFAVLGHPEYTLNSAEVFHLPWGKVSLYSSIIDSTIDFPVYPEEIDDETIANYEQMPDTMYQYEPWQTYKSSGPRTNNFTFKMHRDMWTGDHRDSKCQQLVRFCQANCYPRYSGAAVIPPTVALYIGGKKYIQGIMTSVKPHWHGPIGLDDWYLCCDLEISITEVSQVALNYDSVMKGGLIGWDT